MSVCLDLLYMFYKTELPLLNITKLNIPTTEFIQKNEQQLV